MYLKKLTVRAGVEIIREVLFKRGLNLIIDETSAASIDSGNNVGKTTLLRSIDFCLGGKKDGIYTEKEFKKQNKKIYDFLTGCNVKFELELETKDGRSHNIVRPIAGKSSIDGTIFQSDAKFAAALLLILFNSEGGRPTLAELMNKFIRIEDYQISNALRFLFPATDDSTYEALFLFLFGFRDCELLGKKRVLVNDIKELRTSLESSPHSITDLEQQLHLLNKEVADLTSARDSLDFGKSVANDLAILNKLQTKISELKSLVARLNLRIELNKEALKQLLNSKSNISTDSIAKLYSQAKIEFPNLKKKYEDVFAFHNQMIENKVKYLQAMFGNIEKQVTEKQGLLQIELQEESKVMERISKVGALAEYDNVNVKLQEKSREKGVKEGLIQSLGDIGVKLSKAIKELEEINSKLEGFELQFNANIKKFNEYFSDFSNKLYGDKYYIVPQRKNNKTTDNYTLVIGNMNENVGTGKKTAQISALDLAYLKFAEISNYDVPLFVIHDRLETVFENQIETLFSVANSSTGQFIVAVLSDKLHNIDKEKIKESCVLKLSQADKFFKLD